MQIMGLQQTIETCRTRENRVNSEPNAQRFIIDPILSVLDWSVNDPDRVETEFKIYLNGKFARLADYALLEGGNHSKPLVLIEAKAPGKMSIEGEEQLFNYGYLTSSPILVFSDGKHWDFYKSYDPHHEAKERKFCSLDLMDDDIAYIIESLEKYLARDKVVSGEAYRNAEQDFAQLKQLEHAKGEFRKWWNAQLKAPSEDLASVAKEFFEHEHSGNFELGIGTIQSLIKDASASLKDRTAPDLISQKTVSPIQRYNQSDRFVHTQKPARSRKPREKLRVTYGDRETLFYTNASHTFERVMKWLIDDHGINNVAPCSYSYLKTRADAERSTTFPDRWVSIAGTDYWLSLVNSTKEKEKTLNDIKRHLGIRNLTVEVLS